MSLFYIFLLEKCLKNIKEFYELYLKRNYGSFTLCDDFASVYVMF